MKKLWMIIAICIMLAVPAYAEEQEVFTSGDYEYVLLKDGTAEITDYSGDDEELEVPEELDGYTVTSIGDTAFVLSPSLLSITLPDSVTSIGDHAFEKSKNLTITVGHDSYAAEYCEENGLNYTYPDQEETQEETETASRSMVKVEVEVSNTDILKDRAGSVILDPENVVAMYIQVYPDGSINCEDFVLHANEDYTMTLKYNEVSEIKEFHTGEDDGHYYILSIDYATGDVAFKMVPEQGLLAAGNYTYYVNEDGTVTISGWKGDDKEIAIPEKIDGRAVTTLGNWAFSYYEDLTTIKVPNSVTTIGDEAFRDCSSLISIELPDSLTMLGEKAFMNCSSLTSIELPDSLTTIGKKTFKGCSSLSSIEFSDSLTTIGDEAFRDCSSLTIVELPDSVTMIDSSSFFGCDRLNSINLPASIKTLDCNPFLYCRSLNCIKVSPDQETFVVIDNVLFNKVEKSLVCYPEGLTESEYIIPEGIQKIGKRAFSSVGELTSIEIPDSVTTIERGAFSGCYSLENIIIPDSVRVIGENTFMDCGSLKSIKIPSSVTAIGDKAFFCCYDLKSVEIPDSVTIIGSKAFDGCNHVTLIVERDSYAEQYAEESEISYTYAE